MRLHASGAMTTHDILLIISFSSEGPNLGAKADDTECKIAMFWVLTVQQDGVKVRHPLCYIPLNHFQVQTVVTVLVVYMCMSILYMLFMC